MEVKVDLSQSELQDQTRPMRVHKGLFYLCLFSYDHDLETYYDLSYISFKSNQNQVEGSLLSQRSSHYSLDLH